MESQSADEFVPENAEFLFERLRNLGTPSQNVLDLSDFHAWRELFAPAQDLFAKRLESLNITEEQAKEATLRQRSSGREGVFAWDRMLKTALNHPAGAIEGPVNYPFAILWLPAAAYVRGELLSHAEPSTKLAPGVLDPLVRHLLKEICSIAAEPTYQIFAEHRKAGGTFETFVQSVRSTGYANLFAPFPALARCITILLSRWIGTSQIFVDRLTEDWQEIAALVDIPAASQRIRSIEPGLSDRHEGGFQAILLEFEDLARVVYKPKDMSLEVAVPDINEWLALEGSTIRFRFPRSVSKGSYGWSEFIAQQPCATVEEVNHYFYRSGVLLCLAYVLNARDLLVDNIVACGPDPVPIDLETFFQAEMQSAHKYGRRPESELPEYLQRSSVMDTGFLPIWQVSGIDTACDFSGLCGSKELVSGLMSLGWENLNSDEMKPVREAIICAPAKNQVLYQGVLQRAQDHLDDICRGFSDLYGFLNSRKESFLNYLDRYSGARGRMIFRSTAVYSRLIGESVRANALVSGVRRGSVFERLFRPPLRNSSLTVHLKNLIDSEVECLTFFDIPRLYNKLDDEGLQLENSTYLPHVLWEPPLATVKRRVKNLQPQTLNYHLENIEEAVRRKPGGREQLIIPDRSVEFAVGFAKEIVEKAELNSRDFLWRLPSFCPEGGVPLVDRLGIYTGDLGALIFLAAVSKASGQPLAESLLDRFLRRWQEFIPQRGTTLGICNGVGSLIYGAALLHRFTDDRRWIEFATRVANQISGAAIRECSEPEITFGIAGFLVALINLHDLTKEKDWLTIAEICAQVLWERFSPDVGWIRPDGDSALGFAHGSAGIAFAGLRYARSTNDELGINLAQRAFEFDRRFYSKKTHNWPILSTDRLRFMRTWCAGLPGILLARATAWDLTGDEKLLAELEEGLQYFDLSLSGTDHWCCGNLGNAEILFFLEGLLGQKKSNAKELLKTTLDRALQSAFYRFSPSLGDNYCFQPSLFRGLSGVGYTLLRFAQPKQFPFILGFEI
jgi:type 2 lantibiotic biosynthesis protein LanM